MSTSTEGKFLIGSMSLYTKTWTPTGPVKAKLVFFHGFSDHINRYYELFPHLASCGIQVLGFDQRGWGRSVHKPSERGLTGPTSLVLSDMAAFLRSHLPSREPLFVMGHSMGGGEVLTLVSDAAYDDLVAQIHGWLLESPFIAFPPSEEPPKLKVVLGRLAARVLPNFQLYNPLPPEYLSRDPAVVASVKADPLCHSYGTLEGLAGLLDRTEALAHGRTTLSRHVRRLFQMHGTADRTTSYDASKLWFERQALEDGRFKSYEGGYHQLHSDWCKDEFYKDCSDWILARCGPEGKEAGTQEAPKDEAKGVAKEGAKEEAKEGPKDGAAKL